MKILDSKARAAELMSRWGWRGGWTRGRQLDVFQLAAELLYLFLENLDLAFKFGIEVLASDLGQKKDHNPADN